MTFFMVLSLAKIACNYKAMQTLQLQTLNAERLELCFADMDNMSVEKIAAKEKIFGARA